MLVNNEVKYSYNDVMVLPSVISMITSRSECNPYDKNDYLPLFTAPMTSVVDEHTVDNYERNKIYSIMPRSVTFEQRLSYGKESKRWIAVSMQEFEDNFTYLDETKYGMKVLIDVANGHMAKLYELSKKCKNVYGNNITLMIGNVANPETYRYAVDAGIDYLRVGVGGGAACITASNVAIHMPMASLISEMYEIKKEIIHRSGISEERLPKIVADGGIRNYSDVIKALSLGADYVMIGGIFASLFGSAGEIIDGDSPTYEPLKNLQYQDGAFFEDGKRVFPMKTFYGMASRRGQQDISNGQKKTAEGIEKKIFMKGTIEGWVENMTAYLRSAMSYTNRKKIEDMGDNKVIVISQGTKERVNR